MINKEKEKCREAKKIRKKGAKHKERRLGYEKLKPELRAKKDGRNQKRHRNGKLIVKKGEERLGNKEKKGIISQ